MSLDARLVVQRAGGFRLDVTLRARAGQTVALLGPNGAGKTTALRALAGLTPLDEGRIALGEKVWDEPGESGRFVPTSKRPLGVVFQDHRLFGQLSALENVAFGQRSRGIKRGPARAAALDWLRRLDIAALADSMPGSLSGGQAQRVALARALAVRPDLLLLDEPTAALDANARLSVRAELGTQLAEFDGCAVLVTHDLLDALTLATWLVVLESGSVVQEGTPLEIASRPRTDYVATLVGLNLCRATSDGRLVEIDGGGRLEFAAETTGSVFLAFPPSAVRLHRAAVPGSWPVRVAEVAAAGGGVRIRLDGNPAVSADVPPATVAELGISPGSALFATVRTSEIRVYPC
ncbi:ABC transporter ATP-binding protein [Actinoalloteichus hymeniacidonis]|uniref:ABC-type spermidine/putrescine transport system, ATPase component n=1 Tax=Actinoalloteichus hymeniacidonis TaxID=340345 RepID=A0AAC9MXM5_9PSEU|nr:ABC transporter ATP-binding protein [Actinoalloteichus hymeniacidonis]AOS62415.1 ABC-type spermidine/putrescine transport system, ATPase component [Actinoalloteichus hymeniacidonis]MBB5909554.1 molybdate transport system ATP-binding protein [Actinoalloteichus hymeniacidonis]